jgi:hypothetical protein
MLTDALYASAADTWKSPTMQISCAIATIVLPCLALFTPITAEAVQDSDVEKGEIQ